MSQEESCSPVDDRSDESKSNKNLKTKPRTNKKQQDVTSQLGFYNRKANEQGENTAPREPIVKPATGKLTINSPQQFRQSGHNGAQLMPGPSMANPVGGVHMLAYHQMPYNSHNGYDQTSSSTRQPVELSSTNVFIRGLRRDHTDTELEELCRPFGPIQSKKVIYDKATNSCRGYGFIDFINAADAEKCVKELSQQGYQIQKAKLRQPMGTGSLSSVPVNQTSNLDLHSSANVTVDSDPTNLYIANLPTDFDDEQLRKMLNSYGYVISTRILRNNDGSSRGVGFARMESKEKCEQIIAALNNKPMPKMLDEDEVVDEDASDMHDGAPLLQVKFADSGKKPRRQNISTTLDPYFTNVPSDYLSNGGQSSSVQSANINGHFAQPQQTMHMQFAAPPPHPIPHQHYPQFTYGAQAHQTGFVTSAPPNQFADYQFGAAGIQPTAHHMNFTMPPTDPTQQLDQLTQSMSFIQLQHPPQFNAAHQYPGGLQFTSVPYDANYQ